MNRWHNSPWRPCAICERPLKHDWDPYYVGGRRGRREFPPVDPDHYKGDGPYVVALRNHLYVQTCWSCWMKWPGDHALTVHEARLRSAA